MIAVFALRLVLRRAMPLAKHATLNAVRKVANSQMWTQSHPVRTRLSERYPRLSGFIKRRANPHVATGLPLTLIVIAALYLLSVFSGLTEELLESGGTIKVDDAVNAWLNG